MSKEINIEEFKLLLPDYVSGMLDADQSSKVSEAIKLYPELRKLYEELKLTASTLSGFNFPEPDDKYWETLASNISNSVKSLENKKQGSFLNFRYFAAAAVLLIMVFAYFQKDNLLRLFISESTREISLTDSSDSIKSDKELKVDELKKTETDSLLTEDTEIVKSKKKHDLKSFKEETLVESTYEEEEEFDNLFQSATYDLTDIDELYDLTKDEEEKLIEEILNTN
ncbi:MAG: hypothetical protein N2510_06760 [Ignavibacteria bacterium]|nr:hypothetical protein [Ignavibacteria bacterium]